MNRFARTELLLGERAMRILAASRVAVFGIGGVGGFCAEALARSGVGAIDLIDHDRVSPTNLNRQIVALESTVGRFKAEVMAERIADINPGCRVTAHVCFYLPETAGEIDLARFDYVVDAVDNVTAKLLLAEQAQAAGVPIISSMGTANKLNPAALQVTDIFQTSVCPLARIMRKECRKRGISHLKVVYSTEPPRRPSPEAQAAYLASIAQASRQAADAQNACQAAKAQDAANMDTFTRSGVPASTAFVPPAAGLLLASEAVRDLAGR